MEVQFVNLSIDVPKEMNDVRIALVELIEDIKAGKSITDIAAENLPNVMKAVEGFDQLDDEAKTEQAYDCYGLTASGIAKALMKKKEAQPSA